MRFNYQARTKTGEIQSGIVEASSREAAFNVLKSHNLYVTALEEAGAVPFYAKRLRIFERITRKDIVLFSRQLAIMFKSNVPVVETFRTIAKQTRKHTFREVILNIAGDVEGGTPLSKALASYPKLFSPFYINMVRSGEASGKLTEVFSYLADHLEKEHAFRGKIKGAMVYPFFILFVFAIVVIVIMVYVIPQLSAVLLETGRPLPLITRAVIGVSVFLRTKGIIIILGLVVLVIAIFQFAKSKTGKRFFDKYSLRVPVLSSFLKKLYLARFALNLSTLISGGLPIARALEITGEVVGNNIYRQIILKTKTEVERGETISSVLEKYPDFISPLFYQMIRVGEKTGTLDTSLMNVVDFYQRDVDRNLEGFTRLLEPIFIILLGGVVGLLMASVLMPLYSIGMP